MRLYKLKALTKLGIEDLTKNMSVFVYVLLPLLFALLYTNMDISVSEVYIYSLCVLMNIAMTPVTLLGTIIAEEKEKNTLRTLMLNDVKSIEIMIAKVIICMLFVIIDNIVIYFIIGLSIEKFVLFQFIGVYVACAVILFGTFVGVVAKNQMSAGLMSMPFMILFMAPMFINMIENEVVGKILEFLPTDAMVKLFESISNSKMSWKGVGMPLVVIALWMVISIVMYSITFNKNRMDN